LNCHNNHILNCIMATKRRRESSPLSSSLSIENSPAGGLSLLNNALAVNSSSLAKNKSSLLNLTMNNPVSSSSIPPTHRYNIGLYTNSNFPRFPFIGHWFSIKLCILDHRHHLIKNKDCSVIPIKYELCVENTTLNAATVGNANNSVQETVSNSSNTYQIYSNQQILELHPSTPARFAADATIELKFRFNQTSFQSENKNFHLRFSIDPAYNSVINPQPIFINALLSPLLTSVRYRIKIVEQPPSIWYKDEGNFTSNPAPQLSPRPSIFSVLISPISLCISMNYCRRPR
jgi:hypothetical protein